MTTRFPMNALTYEEYLSNTAHQREVADLRAAGLNPVLSSGGSGASTPSISDTSMKAIEGMMNVANQAVKNSARAVNQSIKASSSANASIAGAMLGLNGLYNVSPNSASTVNNGSQSTSYWQRALEDWLKKNGNKNLFGRFGPTPNQIYNVITAASNGEFSNTRPWSDVSPEEAEHRKEVLARRREKRKSNLEKSLFYKGLMLGIENARDLVGR